MQYPLLTLLDVLATILFLFIGIVIVYFIARIFNKSIKFSSTLLAFILYEIGALIIFLIIDIFSGSISIIYVQLILLIGFLYVLFYLIFKKCLLLNYKASIIIFVCFLIIMPILGYMKFVLLNIVEQSSLFLPETQEMQTQIDNTLAQNNLFTLMNEDYIPESFKIMNKINKSIFSGPSDYITKIVVSQGN